jgi:carboxypeptidase PM20D1
LILGLLLIALFAIILMNTFSGMKKHKERAGQAEFIKTDSGMAARLAGAVRIRTISAGDTIRPDSASLLLLHDYIAKEFPLVSRSLRKKVINKYSLLYEWTGSDAALEPVILAAHMDVVPADTGEGTKWITDPYSGEMKDGYLYGRGTLDDKVSVFGILEAAEKLLKKGFRPRRTIYFAFGHDEETGGREGAAYIAQYLAAEKIHAQFVLDEGLAVTKGIVSGVSRPVALIGIAEKGFVTLTLSVHIPGGHSSYPHKENAISVLSKALLAVTEHPFPARFTTPVEAMFNKLAPYMPFIQRMALRNRWFFGSMILNQMSGSHTLNAGIRTTTAPAIFQAGLKDNIVPDDAVAVLNFRILPGDSIQGVIEEVKKKINDARIQIKAGAFASEPSEVSEIKTEAFKEITDVAQAIFPQAIMAPSLVIGATDSRHYREISRNIYRFLPIEVNDEDLSRIHGSNERISIENYGKVISFYFNLFQKN